MHADVDIASVASLIADPARARFLVVLSDGRALPASQLAREARISPSAASAHLTKLVECGLLEVERCGRHRYFTLANPTIVQALEALALCAAPTPVRSLRESDIGHALHFARTCYDHVAGYLGVQLTRSLLSQEVLKEDGKQYALTSQGMQRLQHFGIDIVHVQKQRRAFASCCLDWSERRHHLAGALGAALTTHLFALGWITRTPSSRAICVTTDGKKGLRDEFGLSLEAITKG